MLLVPTRKVDLRDSIVSYAVEFRFPRFAYSYMLLVDTFLHSCGHFTTYQSAWSLCMNIDTYLCTYGRCNMQT